MAQPRESYTINFRLQTRDSHRKAIYQWLKSHDESTQQDLIRQAVEVFYRCYGGQFEGLSEEQLWQVYHVTKAQVDHHFYNIFVSLFGYEKAGILANQYNSEKGEPKLGKGSQPEPLVNPKSSSSSEKNQADDLEDDLYGDQIDEELDDEVSF